MGAGINTSSLIVNYIAGYFINKNQMQVAVIIWLLLSVTSVLFTIWWNVLDKKRGGDSQRPSAEIDE